MTLFWRIFLSFWLAAVLLASSFFLLGRYSSSQIIDKTENALKAQAEVVAALWLNQGGQPATQHWLFQQTPVTRPLLLNQQGQSPFQHHRDRSSAPWQYGSIHTGVKFEQSGRVTISAALPGVQPPLYLVQQLDPSQLQNTSVPIMFLLALFVIGLVSFILATMLVRPIRQLRNTVRIITAGDLSARVNLSGRDEVSALAKDFNLMAERINEMMTSQRQLVSDVSHELRSPLARLRIALELAERAENPASALNKIAKEADELEQLVSDLLSLARMESGQSILERQAVKLCPLIQKIVDDANFEGEVMNRKVALEHCDDVEVSGDPVLLHSAIENVIRNALRYTADGTNVIVRLMQNNDTLQIIIDDQGPGVPEQQLVRLFEPFARVGEARDRNGGGYGLGLAITGRTLIAHNGQASAQNKSDGGLRVTLTLPI